MSAVDYQDYITFEPGKRSGQPCIRRMRLTVYDVFEYLAGGMSIEEVMDDFPELTRDDISAICDFAARIVRRTMWDRAIETTLRSEPVAQTASNAR